MKPSVYTGSVWMLVLLLTLSASAQVRTSSRSLPPRIGVMLSEVGKETQQGGARIVDVVKDSPAEKAGIKTDDIITAIGSTPVDDVDDVRSLIRRSSCDTTLAITVQRAGAPITLSVSPECQKIKTVVRTRRVPAFSFSTMNAASISGLTLHPVRRQLARFFNLTQKGGLLVENVEKGSAAEKAGLQAGDVLVTWNGKAVRDMDDLWLELDDAENGDQADLGFVRKGKSETRKMTIEDLEEGSGLRFYGNPPAFPFHFRMNAPTMPVVPDLEDLRDLDIDVDVETTPGNGETVEEQEDVIRKEKSDTKGSTKIVIRKKRSGTDI